MCKNINNYYYLRCKNIGTAIRRAQKMLEEKAKKSGIYENFGQEEVRNIRDKFIDLSDYTTEMNSNRTELKSFNHWCTSFTL